MPPSNTPVPLQQSNNHKQHTPKRVVPAIPLSLSKPKPPKSKPKAEPDVRVGGGVTQDVTAKDMPNGPQAAEFVTNGDTQHILEAESVQNVERADNAMRMPASDTPGSRGSGSMSISYEGTPEVPTADPTHPSTPPPAQEMSATASPASSRKPTDRFDMRHIRTELPPAFVPSAENHTPKSAGSSHSNRPQFYAQGHPTHPSANSIVFGGQDSSTSSPAPPLSPGSGFVPPPYANFGAAQQPYYSSQGHSHHASEPYGRRMYQPTYPQPAMAWAMRQGYGNAVPQAPYFQPHGHVPFHYPPREVFTPAEAQRPNGQSSRSRSMSQASSGVQDPRKSAQTLQSPLSPEDAQDSSKTMFSEPKAAFLGHAHPRQPQFNPQMPPPPQYPHPDVTSGMENAEALRAHVHSYFSNPTLADCFLSIVDESDGSQQTILGHRIILSRSTTILALIQDVIPGSFYDTGNKMIPNEVQVSLKGQYVGINAFTDAIKYLYGGPLLQLDHHRPGSSAGERIPSNVDRMENALRHIATGSWLRLPAVAGRGVDVAGGLLHWDTISTALAFALDGGLSHIWTVEDGSEDRASTSSSDDSLGRTEIAAAPTYDPYSTHLLQRIVDFTVHVFPPNFYLDASAPQLSACPRLPSIPQGHGSQKSRSDPRLSQIRFGEIPIEDHQRPSFATTTISSVLLSLPFPLLKCVLEHYDLAARLGSETVASIMRQVVAERETRRAKVLQARVTGQADEVTNTRLVQNLYWVESVEPTTQHRAGFRLARRKREIDTPPSSGACSELNK